MGDRIAIARSRLAGRFENYINKECGTPVEDDAEAAHVAAMITPVAHQWKFKVLWTGHGTLGSGQSDYDFWVDTGRHVVSDEERLGFAQQLDDVLEREGRWKSVAVEFPGLATTFQLTRNNGTVLSFDVVFSESEWARREGFMPTGHAQFHDRPDMQKAVKALKLVSSKRSKICYSCTDSYLATHTSSPSAAPQISGTHLERLCRYAYLTMPIPKPSTDSSGILIFRQSLQLLLQSPSSQHLAQSIRERFPDTVQDDWDLPATEFEAWKMVAGDVLSRLDALVIDRAEGTGKVVVEDKDLEGIFCGV